MPPWNMGTAKWDLCKMHATLKHTRLRFTKMLQIVGKDFYWTQEWGMSSHSGCDRGGAGGALGGDQSAH